MVVVNGHANGQSNGGYKRKTWAQIEADMLNRDLVQSQNYAKFHGDPLIGNPIYNWSSALNDLSKVFTFKNAPEIWTVFKGMAAGKGLDIHAGAQLVGSLPNNSKMRAGFTESQVQAKYDKMLHPPSSYLGDAFRYRSVDGKFNNAMLPHLGQAASPYAKTVPSKTHALGALPDPGDLFDKLMAREDGGRESTSGLSSMLIYHATIIIHDIFRTNDSDKNISDSSSYLDLSPLYGYTKEMQMEVRDQKYKLGLLKPDTFAEDRLLRQPAGVCIMLVMYNRYHNYAATQLRRINENGRFSVPTQYGGKKLVCTLQKYFADKKMAALLSGKPLPEGNGEEDGLPLLFKQYSNRYDKVRSIEDIKRGTPETSKQTATYNEAKKELDESAATIDKLMADWETWAPGSRAAFEKAYDAAWDKLDEDLFQTARLITNGIYIQISIHDYLRALMGFNQYDTDFTLDPRIAMDKHKNVSRGQGNQVTVEFNLLYRFHCAISKKDEGYAEEYMREFFDKDKNWDAKSMNLEDFMTNMKKAGIRDAGKARVAPHNQTFGITSKPEQNFQRHPITGLFNDQQMVDELMRAMEDPISNFGPRNVPQSLRAVEILGIMQARKWDIGSLNDFREFFDMKRHETFESITGNKQVQDALRDLYDHPDKVELYPGIFCESDKDKNADPGPSGLDSALWSAIFSDAITLVRSDRFYTLDWNTKNLTSWGMKEVTPDTNVLKSSVFHRLLQRSFPEWFGYDSIYFFHPFYTPQTNAQYAKDQGYLKDFRIKSIPQPVDPKKPFDISASVPEKPWKPIYLKTHDDILNFLKDPSDKYVHPARLALKDLPKKVQQVLKPGQVGDDDDKGFDSEFEHDSPAIRDYMIQLCRDIIKRECILMKQTDSKTTYQIDITRDFAIPVTTRYVSDFLGFGHLVRSDTNQSAPYSENEIYQHITNCQTFLSYNADETKLFKRRVAFRKSMTFLYNLTVRANVLEANRWAPVQWLHEKISILFGRHTHNPMTELGFKVAKQILHHEHDAGKAAAILLLVGLDTAYNNVLSFTAVLHNYVIKLYDTAKGQAVATEQSWLAVQQTAYSGSKTTFEDLKRDVLGAQRACVRLPVIRIATDDGTIKSAPEDIEVKKGQVIYCDINAVKYPIPATSNEQDYLSFISSFSSRFSHYHPKHVAVIALTSMIQVLAQTKNLRPGHDSQGQLKRINIDSSYEGYSNFMAPGRMRQIEAEVISLVQNAPEDQQAKAREEANKVFTTDVLKPKTTTYLTPEWDEFIPFPTTWKIRFDGFGISDYGGKGYPDLHKKFDTGSFDFPPFYQPTGASATGGSFDTPVCEVTLERQKKEREEKKEKEKAAAEKQGMVGGAVTGEMMKAPKGGKGDGAAAQQVVITPEMNLGYQGTNGCGIVSGAK